MCYVGKTAKYFFEFLGADLMKMTDMLSDVDCHTLVVFDLDYTLYRSTTNLGMPEWIYHLAAKEEQKGISKLEAFQKWYPIWLKAQEVMDLELMDPNIPLMLNNLVENSAGFIGLTARGPESAKVTQQQLQTLGLRLDETEISQIPIFLGFNNSVILENGILFAHEFNDKGEVFFDWFQKIQIGFSEAQKIQKIIFIDDSEKNVVSMEKAVAKLNLKYCGYYYTAANIFKEKFNPVIADKEAHILLQNHSHAEIKAQLKALWQAVEIL